MKKLERHYEEYYCRVMVENFLPQYSFEKSERPDWIDKRNNIGMECTIAQVNDGYATARKYAEYVYGKCRNPENRLKELNEKGEVNEWFYLHETTDGNALPSMQTELDKKLLKLNENAYQKFNENWLAFYVDNPFEERDCEKYYRGLLEIQNKPITVFDKILLCNFCGFGLFDMKNQTCQYFSIEDDKLFSRKAKDFAIREEGN